MAKNTNIADIIKSHPELTNLQHQIKTMQSMRVQIKEILPKTIQNKIEIVLANPKKLTIFAGNQIIGAKIRQMSPTILRHIQSKKEYEIIETIEIKVTPPENGIAQVKRKPIDHTASSLGFIEEMKKKLLTS